MPDDNKPRNGLLSGLRHSSRLDAKVTKVKKDGSALTKLLGNKKSRKSFSFEEDDGFVFKRADSKIPNKQSNKKKKETTTSNKSRQSILAQIETPSEDEQQKEVVIPKKKRGRKPKQQDFSLDVKRKKTNKKSNVEPPVSPPISSPAKKSADYDEHHETSIQMLLPVSDSPIQKRNKKIRESSKRRSSLGNRGKRASSIGNGFVAVPHADVPVEDFHKHLDESLPEPHKMRKLLIWCSKRLLLQENVNLKKLKDHTSSEELTAFNIAKVIKEEIIRDLMDGRLNTSWYSRVESEDKQADSASAAPVKLLPNIQNLTNASNIKLLQKRLQDLRDEKLKWIKAYETIPNLTVKNGDDGPISTPLDQDILKFMQRYDFFEKNSLKSQSLESRIDNFDNLVNKLNTDDQLLSLFQQKIKMRINHLWNDYTTSLSGTAVGTDVLLKGISRIEGGEEEE